MVYDSTGDMERFSSLLRSIHLSAPSAAVMAEYFHRIEAGLPIGVITLESASQPKWLADIDSCIDLAISEPQTSDDPRTHELRIVRGRIANQHGYQYGPVNLNNHHNRKNRF